MKRTLIVASILLAAAACKKSGGDTTPDPSGTGGGTGAAPSGDVVTLVDVSQGDAACYVVVRGADGVEATHPGTFDLCEGGGADASGLMGQQVILTIEKQNMMAASCEGDPECPDTEEVD